MVGPGAPTRLTGDGATTQRVSRLGHRVPNTTLRHDVHAMALHDEDIADASDVTCGR